MSDLDNKNDNDNKSNEKANQEYKGDLNYIFDGNKNKDENKKENSFVSNYQISNNGKGFSNTNQNNQPYAKLYPQSNYVKIFISIFLAIIFFASGFLIAYTLVPSEEEKLARWIKSTSDKYFYDVDDSGYSFIDNIGDGMTSSLDQYSRFYFGEGLDTLEEENSGIYNDTGMILTIPEGETKVRILKIYGNSPADKAGIKAGDILYKINEEDVEGLSYEYIRQVINDLQSDNEEIIYTFKRKHGEIEPVTEHTFTHLSEKYNPIFSKYYDNSSDEMDGVIDLDDDTAYISLEEFATNADTQFAENLDLFKQNGKKKLILDLRTNLGGSLDILQSVASYLITDEANSQNVKIISAEFKDKTVISYDTKNNYYNDYGFEKIIVLADNYSASATEVLICAMKDYGTIDGLVGVKTYGKAVMQSYFENSDKYGMFITVALLYSPITNVTYNTEGFTPDYAVDFNNAGEYKYDNQLLKAVEEINKTLLII